MIRLPVLLRVLLAFTSIPGTLHAQASPLDFETVAPKPPPEKPDLPPQLPPLEEITEEDNTPVLDHLKSIVLLSNPQALRPEGWPAIDGIYADGTPTLRSPGLSAALQPHIGKPLRFGGLKKISATIVQFYRSRFRPVVDALIPEQDITNGVLQIIVIEGRVGRVLAEGQHWFSPKRLTRAVRARQGDEIYANTLIDDVNWLNRNPFRQSELLFRKGANPGETDLVLKTTDRLPFRPYLNYENTGTALTGEDRFQAGFNWGNAFLLDQILSFHQILSFQYSMAADSGLFHAYSGIWTIPLPWRHLLEFYGSNAESKPDIPDFHLTADSLQLGTRYLIPLPGRGSLKHEFSLGFEFKQSDNNLLFGGASIFASDVEVLQFFSAYRLRHAASHGITSAILTFYWSPGNLTRQNSDAAFRQERAQAEADYAYARLDLHRQTPLPLGFTFHTRAAGQISTTNLLGSEQLSLGGSSSVRGYAQSSFNGDQGWFASLEVHTPAIPLLRWQKTRHLDDKFKLVSFLDAGGLYNVDRLPDEPRGRELLSAGVGFRYRINTWLDIQFDHGWPLHTSDGEQDLASSRSHLGIMISY